MVVAPWWFVDFFLRILLFFLPGPGPLPEKQVADTLVRGQEHRFYYRQGKHFLLRKEYDSAYQAFGKAELYFDLNKKPDSAFRSSIYLAEIAMVQGDLKKGDSILKSSINLYEGLISNKSAFVFAEFQKAKGVLNFYNGRITETISNLRKAVEIATYTKSSVDSTLEPFYYILGSSYQNLYNNDSCEYFYEKAIQCLLLANQKVNGEIAQIYFYLGSHYKAKGYTTKAISYFDLGISTVSQCKTIDTNLLIDSYKIKSHINEELVQYDSAIQNISQIESLIPSNDKNNPNRIYANARKNHLYFKIGDFERAETYCLNLLNLTGSNPEKFEDYLFYVYQNMAMLAYKKDNFNKAKEYYTKSIKTGNKLKKQNSSNFNGIASCYFLLNDTITAEKYYQLAIKTRLENNNPNHPFLAYDYLSYSVFLFRIGRQEEGFSYASKALKINRDNYGDKYPETSRCYTWLGSFYLKQHKPELALENFQKAIICAAEGFNNNDLTANPDLSGNIYGPELLDALKFKADALDSLYHKDHGTISTLYNELNTYELALRVIHKLRTSFPEFNSKLMVSGNQRKTYLGAVNAACQMYMQTQNREYLSKAFEFAEKSRSAILLGSLKERQAVAYGGVPDSLVEKEKALNQAIESYQGLLVQEKQKQNPQPDAIKELERKIFQLKNSQNSLVEGFEKKFPNYFKLKYDDRVLSISNIQKRLQPDQVILEYVITDEKILVFCITKNTFQLVPVEKKADFGAHVSSVTAYLNDVNFISQNRDTYDRFLQSAHSLYQYLMKPCLTLIRGKQLIIIPDEELASIPFEVLLTEKATPMMEFGTLPYVINTYPVGYAYSANLLFFSHIRTIPSRIRLAAFSPDYQVTARGNSHVPVLKPLVFAKEEAQTVGRFFKGKVFLDQDATEENFRKVAGRYDVLHLSMHAILDNENPMNSKLVFSKGEKSNEDGYLNTFELFNLQLKARMAVLSACNTGAGAMQKGEGIMSLARGFYYAGCPDVVMTLWPVEDKLSTQLIKDFYTYLREGKNKIEALRLAKLNLIQSSDPLRAHPYFWAGYVNIGEISPLIQIERKKPTWVMWALIAGVLLLIAVPVIYNRLRP